MDYFKEALNENTKKDNPVIFKKDRSYYDELCYYFVSRILPLEKFPQPDEDAVSYLPKRSNRYLRFLATDLRDAPETIRDLDEILSEMYLFDILQRKTNEAEELLKNLIGVPVEKIELKKKRSNKERQENAFGKVKTPEYELPSFRDFRRQMSSIMDKMEKAKKEDPATLFAVSLLIYFKKEKDATEEELKIRKSILDTVVPAICRMTISERKQIENYTEKIFNLEKFSQAFTEDSFGEDARNALKEVGSDEFYEKVSLIRERFPIDEDAKKSIDIAADMSLSTQTEIEHCMHLYKLIFALYAKQKSYIRAKDEGDKKVRSAEKTIKQAENKDKELTKVKEENESLKWQLNDLKKQLEKKDRTIDHLNKDIDNIICTVDEEENDNGSTDETPDTEEEIEKEIKKTEEMITSLKEIKIALIGGAESLTGKLKPYFPDWLYIDAHGSAAKEQIAGKDCVVVMIGYLCHGTMWGIRKHAEECGVPMCYITGTNIDRVIRNIYEGVNDALKENAA